MAVWRSKAIESFPTLRSELEDTQFTIYQLYFALLPMLRDAHSRGDEDAIRHVYAFADWCRTQPARDLWNAAGVAFYEHLFDAWSDRELVVPWLSPGAIRDSIPLWEARLTPVQMAEVQQLIENRSQQRWREYSGSPD